MCSLTDFRGIGWRGEAWSLGLSGHNIWYLMMFCCGVTSEVLYMGELGRLPAAATDKHICYKAERIRKCHVLCAVPSLCHLGFLLWNFLASCPCRSGQTWRWRQCIGIHQTHLVVAQPRGLKSKCCNLYYMTVFTV